MKNLVDAIRPGDRVTILVPNGVEWREKTGRAVMRGPAGWVLNMGGRFGTPGVATGANTVKVSPAKRDSGVTLVMGLNMPAPSGAGA